MILPEKRKKIAVLGAGAAGLTAAYLLCELYEITLFEKNNYLGGHTHTLVIPDGPDAGTPVDTGFIVFNDRNYPTLLKLFSRLGIQGQPSDMSFGVYVPSRDLQYSSYVPGGIFAQKRNLFRPRFWSMLSDIRRFNRTALEDLKEGRLASMTLGEYLAQGRYSAGFTEDYLVPMGAAIWSTPCGQMLDFPALGFIRFFSNHGLLHLTGRPHWMSVPGGSQSYVQIIKKSLHGKFRTLTPALGVRRGKGSVTVRSAAGLENFDHVILAAHADESYRLLEDPTPDESRLLGPWKYFQNHAVLHRDESVMPPNRRAWASWNYYRKSSAKDSPVSLTYDMNRLQSLKTRHPWFVSLNHDTGIDRKKILQEINYTHPAYTFDSIRTQPELPSLNGVCRTWYCGSYFGYGFHEDAVKSAVQVAEALGGKL